MMTLTEQAIIYAVNAHAGTKRKGKNIPYILHPVEAMAIVSKMTDDDEVIAAAVLHDTVEDTSVKIDDIKTVFGDRVAKLVASESENKREDLPADATWQIRKQETINHLKKAKKDVKLICLGDKLANLREIRSDYAHEHEALWDRVNQKDKAMHEWYYSTICDVLEKEFGDVPPIREYRTLLKEVFGEN